MNKICGKRIVTIFYLYICIFIFVWETALMMLQPIIENQLFWKNRAYKKGNTDVLVGNAHIDFMNDAHVLCLQYLHLSYNFIKIQMEFAYVFISLPLYIYNAFIYNEISTRYSPMLPYFKNYFCASFSKLPT